MINQTEPIKDKDISDCRSEINIVPLDDEVSDFEASDSELESEPNGSVNSREENVLSEYEVLIVGLDNSGKTKLLYTIKEGLVVETVPTMGFNVEDIRYGSTNYKMWDIGGEEKVRVLRNFFVDNKSIVIYMIDAIDAERFVESQQDLHELMSNDSLQSSVLLVLLNKTDLLTEFRAEDVTDHLKLEDITQKYWIRSCSVVADENIKSFIFDVLSEICQTLPKTAENKASAEQEARC